MNENLLKRNRKIELSKIMIEITKEKVNLSKDIMDRTFSEFRIGLNEALSLNEAQKSI